MSEKNIIVIGDVMLDEYWNGNSTRISPEVPVPIVDDIRVSHVLGGAANVALTCNVFGSKTTVFGSLGYDKQGMIITHKLTENDIKYFFSYSYENKTIVKIRIMSDDHQLVRVDHGNITYPYSNKLPFTPDIIIVSDYNKGTICPEYLEYIVSQDCPVIVDPKGTDWSKYKGAYCLTPNLKEFEEAYGEFNTERARAVVNELDLEGILVTLGSKGLHWVSEDKSILMPSEAKEVFDVTGAGDTVIGTFASFLHEGIVSAMEKANKAAGNVVGHIGTAVPDKSSVLETVVFTNGCFDIIHSGHINLLQSAKAMGDKLIVAINSDDSMRRIKREPINDMYERKEILESIAGVDRVIIFEDDTPYDLIKDLKPDIIVKGGDYTKDNVVGADLAEVRIIGLVNGRSTTKTINKAKERSKKFMRHWEETE